MRLNEKSNVSHYVSTKFFPTAPKRKRLTVDTKCKSLTSQGWRINRWSLSRQLDAVASWMSLFISKAVHHCTNILNEFFARDLGHKTWHSMKVVHKHQKRDSIHSLQWKVTLRIPSCWPRTDSSRKEVGMYSSWHVPEVRNCTFLGKHWRMVL